MRKQNKYILPDIKTSVMLQEIKTGIVAKIDKYIIVTQ